MAGKSFPIGSIVKVGAKKGIVTGIVFDETDDDHLVKSYILAAYPIGYTGAEYLRQIPAADAELVCEGYRSPIGEPFLNYMDNIEIASKMADAKTVTRYLDEAREKLYGGNN